MTDKTTYVRQAVASCRLMMTAKAASERSSPDATAGTRQADITPGAGHGKARSSS